MSWYVSLRAVCQWRITLSLRVLRQDNTSSMAWDVGNVSIMHNNYNGPATCEALCVPVFGVRDLSDLFCSP